MIKITANNTPSTCFMDLIYPALLATVGDAAPPCWRATSVGVYRFWRDLGYAIGVLMSGIMAGVLGLVWAVHAAGLLTFFSGLLAGTLMIETLKEPVPTRTLPGARQPDTSIP